MKKAQLRDPERKPPSRSNTHYVRHINVQYDERYSDEIDRTCEGIEKGHLQNSSSSVQGLPLVLIN